MLSNVDSDEMGCQPAAAVHLPGAEVSGREGSGRLAQQNPAEHCGAPPLAGKTLTSSSHVGFCRLDKRRTRRGRRRQCHRKPDVYDQLLCHYGSAIGLGSIGD